MYEKSLICLDYVFFKKNYCFSKYLWQDTKLCAVARLCLPLTTEQIVLQFIPSEMPKKQLDGENWMRHGGYWMQDGGCYMRDAICGSCACVCVWFHLQDDVFDSGPPHEISPSLQFGAMRCGSVQWSPAHFCCHCAWQTNGIANIFPCRTSNVCPSKSLIPPLRCSGPATSWYYLPWKQIRFCG